MALPTSSLFSGSSASTSRLRTPVHERTHVESGGKACAASDTSAGAPTAAAVAQKAGWRSSTADAHWAGGTRCAARGAARSMAA
jgi:hypothetical protein